MQLTKGRPIDCNNRLEKEQRVYELLDKLNIEYYYVDHEPLMTMEACKGVDGVLESVVCKNIFLCNRQMTDFYLLMMPGDKKFVTKDVSKQLGCARLSFANEDKLLEYLDLTPGSVSVLGLMNDKNNNVKLVIDADILNGEYIGMHPCINTSSLKIKIDDLLNKFLNEINHDYIIINMD